MMHDVVLILVWLVAVPTVIFLIAFLAALADCAYAYLFPTPYPALDDSF